MLGELWACVGEAAADDRVYFAELLGMVREIMGPTDDLLNRTGRAAAQLVRDGILVPGTDGFTVWETGLAESAARIEREATAMVRGGVWPRPGDVCWFDLPDG
ncbi:hypothetical protein [Saccharomonospora halophila]|uniref:hypothetical protein n=1 Tax=Saccharomonospora halophila TaxID=129922 RepID=UPI00036F99A6|nr:hypothetical protein [Saccharomonospora halophila]